jgi:alpha-D-ribose 1-methylphosphonate 5-phosphate C-P lyase
MRDSISVSVNDTRYKLEISDRSTNSYYLPLELRKTIAASASPNLEVEIAGIKMPTYKIGTKNATLIATIVNTSDELKVDKPTQSSKSKEERLAELDALRKKGLINDEELKDTRLKILAE